MAGFFEEFSLEQQVIDEVFAAKNELMNTRLIPYEGIIVWENTRSPFLLSTEQEATERFGGYMFFPMNRRLSFIEGTINDAEMHLVEKYLLIDVLLGGSISQHKVRSDAESVLCAKRNAVGKYEGTRYTPAHGERVPARDPYQQTKSGIWMPREPAARYLYPECTEKLFMWASDADGPIN